MVYKWLWFEQLKTRQAITAPLRLNIPRDPHSKPGRLGNIVLDFHSGKKVSVSMINHSYGLCH